MSLNQSQLNKSRLDKFLMVINLPDPLKNINTTDLAAHTDKKVNENSLQFSVYGAVIPSIQVPAITNNTLVSHIKYLLIRDRHTRTYQLILLLTVGLIITGYYING